MRYRAKVDGNQGEIVEALRDCGASVTSLAAVGQGVPDLLVGWRGANLLVEVKLPKGDLTPPQEKWHGAWRGQVAIVRGRDEALALLGVVPSPRGEECAAPGDRPSTPRGRRPRGPGARAAASG